MEMDKEMYERRVVPPPKGECSKIDTFVNISDALKRLESKIDGLAKDMQGMIRLEQQLLEQSKDIEYIHNSISDLRKEKEALSLRLTTLQKDHEAQSKSISNYERIIWAVATCGAIIVGKYVFGIG